MHSPNIQGMFFLNIYMSVICQFVSVNDSLGNVSDNGLFQLSGERSCSFKTSIGQATKTCMLPTALDVPEDMIHRSVLALEMQGFS